MSAENKAGRRDWRVPAALVSTVCAVGALGAWLVLRARAEVNLRPLTAEPKGVTVTAARQARYQATKRFVGTVQPWGEARLGPQLVSAYVDAVNVRPGSVVRKGEILASLDCRNASTAKGAVAQQARALEERQRASAREAGRLDALGQEGFVALNDVERKSAEARAEGAALAAVRAQLAGKALEVDDCVLRAPFDGEVARRAADPGAFVRPGTSVVTMVDRSVVRIVVQVPEVDFSFVGPGTVVAVTLLADGRRMELPISRVTPQADPATRTLGVEIDVRGSRPPPPTGVSAEVEVAVGAAADAVEIPLSGARVRGDKATLFLVEGDVARTATADVLGERGASLFLRPRAAEPGGGPALGDGARVVVEGRQQLKDGDRVLAKTDAAPKRSGK